MDTDFRIDDLLVLAFKESEPEIIKKSISFRINKTKELNKLIQTRMSQICNIIDQRNPTLLAQIKNNQSIVDQFAATGTEEQIRIDTSLWIDKY